MWLRKLKPRFGIRALLALTACIAVLVGGTTNFARKVQRTNEIVAQFEAKDAIVHYSTYSICGIDVAEHRIPNWAWNFCGEAAFADVLEVEFWDIEDDGISDAECASICELSSLTDLHLEANRLPDNAFESIARLKQLQQLSIWSADIPDDRLRHLAKCSNLRGLDLTEGEIAFTDRTLEGIGSIKNLESLDLHLLQSTPSPNGISSLARLPKLRELTIGFCDQVNANALMELGQLPRLVSLRLLETRISREGLHVVAALDQLEQLDLSGSELDEDDLAYLSESAVLRLLVLRRTNLSDRGAEHLVQCRNLEFLDLQETKISSDAVARLADLKKLRFLKLDTDIDEATLLGLSRRLPKCQIVGRKCVFNGVSEEALANQPIY